MTTKSLVHKFSSAVADDANSSHVRPSNWNADHNFFLGVNAQTGTSYTFVDGDDWSLVSFSNGSAVAVTLPQANPTTTFVPGWVTFVRNLGAGTVTITPTTSTIDGAASLALLSGHSAIIVSDGTNYTTLPMANLPIVVASGKTVTINNSLTFAGTDGKTLTVSNSGTLSGGDGFTLSIAASKTLAVSNSITLAGTDSTTMTFPAASDTVAGLGTAQTFTKQNIHNVATTIASATGAALDDVKVSAATTTITGNTGSPITLLAKVGLYRPTLTDSSAVTVTDAATLYVDNAPLAAGSVTITNPWAILVGAGATKLQATTINGTLTAAAANFSGNAITTAELVGGTGVYATSQVGTLRASSTVIDISSGVSRLMSFGSNTSTIGTLTINNFSSNASLGGVVATFNAPSTASVSVGTGALVIAGGVGISGTLTAATVTATGITATLGPAGTGTSTNTLFLNGASGAGAGNVIRLYENGTEQWAVGQEKAIFGSGTTKNFVIWSDGAGLRAVSFDYATGAATFGAAVTFSGVPTFSAGVPGATIVNHNPGTGAGLWYNGNATAQQFFVGTDGTDNVFRIYSAAAGTNSFSYDATTHVSTFLGNVVAGGIFLKGSSIANATGLDVTASASGVYSAAISNSHNTSGDLVLVIAGGPTSSTDTGTILIGFNSGNFSAVVGTITRNGAGAVAYNLSSDARGKPNRERLSPALARRVVDALEMYDFDKEGNAIRGYGGLAQQMYGVHRSLATPGSDDDENWIKRPWQAEKAAPMPFVIANLQQLNARMDALEQRRAA